MWLACVSVAGCLGPAATAHDGRSAAVQPSGFSAERAYADLVALSDIGPRVTGTEGAARARDYLRAQLEAMGAEVREETTAISSANQEKVLLTHLVGVLPGESEDLVLLAAHYDTFPAQSFEFVGANGSASGPAVVLELGRVASARKRPYTIWLVFIDGDEFSGGVDGRPYGYAGSKGLAALWTVKQRLVRTRIAFFFEGVADPDLVIARDLRSQRAYRERLWEVAAELGHADAFPPDAPFESPDGSHVPFIDRNLRQTVAVVDDRFGSGDPPGSFHQTDKDTPDQASVESLAVVGDVVATTLARIEAHLVRIDRFVNRSEPAAETDPAAELESSSDGTTTP